MSAHILSILAYAYFEPIEADLRQELIIPATSNRPVYCFLTLCIVKYIEINLIE